MNDLPAAAHPPTGAIAVVSPAYIRVELEDQTGSTDLAVTVSAGKRLLFSADRADGGLGSLGVHRTGAWQRQDADTWRAPVEPNPM